MKLVVRGLSNHCNPTHVTLFFDEKGDLTNPRAAAQSSMVGWGKWQSSEKVPCHFGDCWWVNTAGHGGYILVSPIKGLGEPTLKVEHSFGTAYVYEFEEDCNWAILEYRDELVRQHALKQSNERLGLHRTETEYINEYLVPCLQRWNKWVLA